ncbi:D-alanyl-glycyl endopeptidase-like protein, putative [Bodo saltans]|uniref:D-alanyl-glycyl endopeptidase-like protein, putative n=1 Tax=Bodo saltans TaxID=75058 RepID=A0A0S4ITA7_BODSA|nr:D-alanyl-glycyl endopeptidase-like protein, putative [Bodo saltans]|eukprot:CUF78957.1 D-alanyl-glycyl endopeptidase-like protein, putative [Bodo saltans]
MAYNSTKVDSHDEEDSNDDFVVGVKMKKAPYPWVDDNHHERTSSSWLPRSLRDGILVCIPACALLLLVVLFLPHNCRGGSMSLREQRSSSGCDTAFGSVIGVSAVGSVTAYSNCNSDYISNLSNFVNVTIPGGAGGSVVVPDVYTGMPWQCVEYARRYWATTSPYTLFGSVDGASDIWTSLHHGTFIESSDVVVQFDLQKFENGGVNATSPPQVGDLFIYPIQPGGFPFGHVTVVLNDQLPPTLNNGGNDVTSEVHVGEQNWDSFQWQHAAEGYSRKLQLTYHQLSRRWSVYDPQGKIAGWVRRPSQRS